MSGRDWRGFVVGVGHRLAEVCCGRRAEITGGLWVSGRDWRGFEIVVGVGQRLAGDRFRIDFVVAVT